MSKMSNRAVRIQEKSMIDLDKIKRCFCGFKDKKTFIRSIK